MTELHGKTVYRGVAAGPVAVWQKKDSIVKRESISDTKEELRRLEKACGEAKGQLAALYEKALEEVGQSSAAIFEVHQMMLEDDDFLDAMRSMIETEKVNAEYAAAVTGDNFAQIFSGMEDEYMKGRAADIKDISNRLVNCLSGEKEEALLAEEPVILVAEDLSPSETVRMDKNKILAFVTVRGSVNSHTAILARMMNIPALVCVPLDLTVVKNGSVAVVDGIAGKFILDPQPEELQAAQKLVQECREQEKLLETLKGKESVTGSGKKINVYANIGGVGDVAYVLENDAEGIGLFRSEFLYLGRDDFPGEEEQLQAYRQVAQMMAGKKVIIRTLDIGADKQAGYFGLEKEENPAMGYRAIRICLTRPEIFKVQLRALFRAAVYGNIAVMYPMITSTEEIKRIRQIVCETEEELIRAGIPYAIPEQGIMIETPAAALISDELAELADFFSIGTNDLTQYTLAIDRQNERLDEFYDPHHRAVLKLIELTVKNAHSHGKWAGICGELGADLSLIKEFVRMGIDELSVSPPMVLRVRRAVREIE